MIVRSAETDRTVLDMADGSFSVVWHESEVIGYHYILHRHAHIRNDSTRSAPPPPPQILTPKKNIHTCATHSPASLVGSWDKSHTHLQNQYYPISK